ncbi:unnamed protein product, partial [Hapterophycus canaliculatus]
MDQKPDAFPSSFLLCKVCDSLLAEPISLPCGHTCCRTCLVKELRKAKECPSCRATCHTRCVRRAAGGVFLRSYHEVSLHEIGTALVQKRCPVQYDVASHTQQPVSR